MAFVFLGAGTGFALCVDYDGDGNPDACSSGGSVPMPTGIERIDTGVVSAPQSSSSTYTVPHSSGPSMESVATAAIIGNIFSAMIGDISFSSEESGPTLQEIEAQRQLEEKKRKEFLRSKAKLIGKLRIPGTTYTENTDVTTTGGLKLKSIPPLAPAGSASGDTHSAFFGQPGSAQPTVELLREPITVSGDGLLDPAEYKKLISNPNLSQDERDWLFIRTKVPSEKLGYTNWVDSRALRQRELYHDPYIDVIMAMAQAGATNYGISLTKKGGKKFLETYGGTDKGYKELLLLGNAAIKPPKNIPEGVGVVGKYALSLSKRTKKALPIINAAKTVGPGVREAIVQYWASKDRSMWPLRDAKDRWNEWYDNLDEWSQAALKNVGVERYKD